jgi:uncharacterized protein YegL
MNKKKTIYQFIIDRSGSMQGMESEAINGFNKQLATLKSLQKEFLDQEFVVSLSFFNDTIVNPIVFGQPEDLSNLSVEQFRPDGLTALLDAVGSSIHKINNVYGDQIRTRTATVVMVIITDGFENASRMYTYQEISTMIQELEKGAAWTFTLLGADMDAFQASEKLNIRTQNVASFKKEHYAEMMDRVSLSMSSYAESKTTNSDWGDFLN